MDFKRSKRLVRRPSTSDRVPNGAAITRADFDMLFEATPTPILLIDRQTLRFRKVNAAALKFYGYDSDEFLRLTLPDIRPEDMEGEIEGMVGRFDDPALPETPRLHVIKSGEQRVVKVNARLFEYEGTACILAAVFDMTREDQLQEEARSARAFMMNVVE